MLKPKSSSSVTLDNVTQCSGISTSIPRIKLEEPNSS
jgi:hypothetical protein